MAKRSFVYLFRLRSTNVALATTTTDDVMAFDMEKGVWQGSSVGAGAVPKWLRFVYFSPKNGSPYKTFGRAPSEELKPGPYQTYPKREGEHVDGALETNMWDGWSSFRLVLGPKNKI
jgi:hypothetical protein